MVEILLRVFFSCVFRLLAPASQPARSFLAMCCLLLAGCVSAPVGKKDLLDFLSDGVTRREDVQLKLGEPSAQYESSRILAYRLGTDETGYVLKGRQENWLGVQHSLILVFDEYGVLRRHALVDVR